MTSPGLVLIHGGSHTSECWQPTVDELARLAPTLQVLAVDLPGRRSTPGDLSNLTVEDCVQSTVDQISQSGMTNVVVVAHSMAGITAPGVVAALGSERVKRLVMLACCVPPEGRTVIDTLNGPLRAMAGRRARSGGPAKRISKLMASLFFCNGMTRDQRQFVLRGICAESSAVTIQPVSRKDLPRSVPRTWILTKRDRSLPPRKQRQFIDNLGGVDEVVELDTCHNAMVSEPGALARLLVERAV
jgi:pimeloyl-ACP methyl ester carboxylesterase